MPRQRPRRQAPTNFQRIELDIHSRVLRSLRPWLLACVALTALPLAAQEKISIQPPPSAQLSYRASAELRGLSLDGQSQIDWRHDKSGYRLTLETRTALTGVLLREQSEGSIDRFWLNPASYSTKRMLKPAAVTLFDRQTGAIQFTGDAAPHALQGGEQDRLSVLWQLLSMMRSRPAAFVAGSRWQFYVAGQRDGDIWTFEVRPNEKLRLPLGELDTVPVTYVPEDPGGKTRVEVWLAPSKDWLPVRIRFSEPNGDFVEQMLERITR